MSQPPLSSHSSSLIGLDYQFSQSALWNLAITHRSFGHPHNERLEFLGDSVVNYALAQLLYARFPDLPEGRLSRFRAALVNQATLAEMALAIGLDQHIRLGAGEIKSGGRQRPSILADAFEAFIGAVSLDSNMDTACRLLQQLFEPRIGAIDVSDTDKDPKSQLQEYIQSLRQPLPQYTVIAEKGLAPNKVLTVQCRLAEFRIDTTGQGASRRVAEQEAAQAALHILLNRRKAK